jgi:UDPglucose 6-dehydrogenase
MRLTVIGTGHLGLVHAACMADIGHDVLGVDADPQKVRLLGQGKVPFFEPGLAALVSRVVRSGKLRFGPSLAEAARFGQLHFICVGTPQLPGSLAADTSQLEDVIDGLVPHLTGASLVVVRSTVPVGTAARLSARLSRLAPLSSATELAWNPEFLREGSAVRDTLQPDRVVVGVTSSNADALLREVYASIVDAGAPYIATDLATAELAKASANAFLATKISFINAMADICDKSGADVVALAEVLGYDSRIGNGGMFAGLGFGGGCLPKDLRGLIASGTELGAGDSLRFLREIEAINVARRARVTEIARELADGDLVKLNVAVLGAAFKPETDDVRDSPALAVAAEIAEAGANVCVHDPEANEAARVLFPKLEYASEVEHAFDGADIVLHLTEWKAYRELDPVALRALVRHPRILDARNVLQLGLWQSAGWTVRGIGVRTGRQTAQAPPDRP